MITFWAPNCFLNDSKHSFDWLPSYSLISNNLRIVRLIIHSRGLVDRRSMLVATVVEGVGYNWKFILRTKVTALFGYENFDSPLVVHLFRSNFRLESVTMIKQHNQITIISLIKRELLIVWNVQTDIQKNMLGSIQLTIVWQPSQSSLIPGVYSVQYWKNRKTDSSVVKKK